MRLVDVYEDAGPFYLANVLHLYSLLRERQPHESISHRAMPSFSEHVKFVESRPYAKWFIVEDSEQRCGAVYLTRNREVGIAIGKLYRGRGLGSLALTAFMRKAGPGRVLANINPANEASIELFRKRGFGGPIQITLEKP